MASQLICIDREGGKVREIRVPGADVSVWCDVL